MGWYMYDGHLTVTIHDCLHDEVAINKSHSYDDQHNSMTPYQLKNDKTLSNYIYIYI